jgi:hypothetical protein
MKTGSLEPRRESRGARGLRDDPAPLEYCVFAFLSDNNYRVLNDNGYLSLDLLIDDNPTVFAQSFESAVLKALGLVYYADGSRQISTCKKRLRENLLSAFEGKKKFVMRLATDHLLLLRVFSTLFKYRVKFFFRRGNDIVSQIFGDKEAKYKVRILYDSIMFYILVKHKQVIPDDPASVEPEDDYPSTVSRRPGDDSQSDSHCLRLLRDQLSMGSGNKQPPMRNQRAKSQKNRDREGCGLRPEWTCSAAYHRWESERPKKFFETFKSSYSHSELVIMLPNTSPSFSVANNSFGITWSNFLDHLAPLKDARTSQSSAGRRLVLLDTTTKQTGVLISYSRSRQCGSILTDQGLEVLVASEELAKAGIPVKLLDISSHKIEAVAVFRLRLLSSEPIPTFEATDLDFTTPHLRQILSSQLI